MPQTSSLRQLDLRIKAARERGFKALTKLSLSEWADSYRQLSPEASAEPGQWHTDRVPYLRQPMDAVSDPDIEMVVFKASSQSAKTELILNALGYFIHQSPSPILVVEPRLEDCKALSKDRISPMLRDSPALNGLVREARSRDSGNTTLHKLFPGGHLTLAGANSAAGLSMRPIRVVLLDEVSRYPASAGTEGDPVTLAVKRTTTFWNRKIILASSPALAGTCRISAAFLETDQRFFLVPCPHCGDEQELKWQQVRWDKDESRSGRARHLPETATYTCEHCGGLWSDAERWEALTHGRWQATQPFKGRAGFHISQLHSPWKRIAELVQEYIDAWGQPEREKAFQNTVLGLEFEERGEAPEFERLASRREDYLLGRVPMGGVILTAGADVQRDRIEVSVWAWGPNRERWLVDHRILPGQPDAPEVWSALDDLLERTWPHESGAELKVERLAIDTGEATHLVYSWARRHRHGKVVMPVKGSSTYSRNAPISGPVYVDIRVAGKRLTHGARLWTVATDTFKSGLYRLLELAPPTKDQLAAGAEWPAGYVHLPADISDEWLRQLTAERLETHTDKRTGRRVKRWVLTRPRNEALDAAVYAEAAAYDLGVHKLTERQWQRLVDNRHLVAMEEEPEAPPPRTTVPVPVTRRPAADPPRRSSWLNLKPGKWL